MAPREPIKLAVALSAVLAVAALIVAAFALPYYDDDVCITSGFAERAGIDSERSLVPAGTECTYHAASGEVVNRFEGPGDWHSWTVLGLIAAAITTLLVGITLSLRDLRMRGTARLGREATLSVLAQRGSR